MRPSQFAVAACLCLGLVIFPGCSDGENKPVNNQGSQATPEMEKMRDDMMKNMQAQMKGKFPGNAKKK
ncbi:hypothetical protein OJF2_25610 [Aquisphaera giovannonii]|uniref:Lipoprotein n=1 Tax=Aquisphaera giovannonii TaxID=406548 RepID=A0A5B9W0E7_9BACT|nr:hypothetical protein [Aquisphaera giovannonii]QEH34028.1 hypothetical protein OJF2_25610 [Aquisphaera giovannonii]